MPVDERLWRRLLDKIEVTDSHWWWNAGTIATRGSIYGSFGYEDETVGAHVMMYHLFYGRPIHKRLTRVRSACGETLCVRPSHLEETGRRNADAR